MELKFDLTQPIQFFNSSVTNGCLSLVYPSGSSYWKLLNDDNIKLIDGNYTFPKDVLDLWVEDDVLINHILSVQPWNVRQPLNNI